MNIRSRPSAPLARRLHYLAPPLCALPDFLIIGAQKGGTSSLFRWLSSHPSIIPAIRKEVHYFDWHYRRGSWWYRTHFPLSRTLRRRGAISGEASPNYLFHPEVPSRMARLVPHAKLIVCLREPAARAISHYWHARTKGVFETLPIQEAFAAEEARLEETRAKLRSNPLADEGAFWRFTYKARGRYAEQLRRFLRHYPLRRIHVLRSEDLFSAPQRTFNAVTDFLGLSRHLLTDVSARNVGTYGSQDDAALRRRLKAYFAPHNEELARLLGLTRPLWP